VYPQQFADSTQLSAAADTTEGRYSIQAQKLGTREPQEIQQGQVQGVGPGQSQIRVQTGEKLESSPAEKHFLVDEKLHMRQQHIPAAQKANSIPGCINRGRAARRGGDCPPLLL